MRANPQERHKLRGGSYKMFSAVSLTLRGARGVGVANSGGECLGFRTFRIFRQPQRLQ